MTLEELADLADTILNLHVDAVEFDYKAEDKNPRHLAYTETDENGFSTVVISPRLARFHRLKAQGVIYHELGHVLDELFDYSILNEPDDELRADRIVEVHCGIRIYYDRRDLVQTLDSSGIWPRPEGLT